MLQGLANMYQFTRKQEDDLAREMSDNRFDFTKNQQQQQQQQFNNRLALAAEDRSQANFEYNQKVNRYNFDQIRKKDQREADEMAFGNRSALQDAILKLRNNGEDSLTAAERELLENDYNRRNPNATPLDENYDPMAFFANAANNKTLGIGSGWGGLYSADLRANPNRDAKNRLEAANLQNQQAAAEYIRRNQAEINHLNDLLRNNQISQAKYKSAIAPLLHQQEMLAAQLNIAKTKDESEIYNTVGRNTARTNAQIEYQKAQNALALLPIEQRKNVIELNNAIATGNFTSNLLNAKLKNMSTYEQIQTLQALNQLYAAQVDNATAQARANNKETIAQTEFSKILTDNLNAKIGQLDAEQALALLPDRHKAEAVELKNRLQRGEIDNKTLLNKIANWNTIDKTLTLQYLQQFYNAQQNTETAQNNFENYLQFGKEADRYNAQKNLLDSKYNFALVEQRDKNIQDYLDTDRNNRATSLVNSATALNNAKFKNKQAQFNLKNSGTSEEIWGNTLLQQKLQSQKQLSEAEYANLAQAYKISPHSVFDQAYGYVSAGIPFSRLPKSYQDEFKKNFGLPAESDMSDVLAIEYAKTHTPTDEQKRFQPMYNNFAVTGAFFPTGTSQKNSSTSTGANAHNTFTPIGKRTKEDAQTEVMEAYKNLVPGKVIPQALLKNATDQLMKNPDLTAEQALKRIFTPQAESLKPYFNQAESSLKKYQGQYAPDYKISDADKEAVARMVVQSQNTDNPLSFDAAAMEYMKGQTSYSQYGKAPEGISQKNHDILAKTYGRQYRELSNKEKIAIADMLVDFGEDIEYALSEKNESIKLDKMRKLDSEWREIAEKNDLPEHSPWLIPIYKTEIDLLNQQINDLDTEAVETLGKDTWDSWKKFNENGGSITEFYNKYYSSNSDALGYITAQWENIREFVPNSYNPELGIVGYIDNKGKRDFGYVGRITAKEAPGAKAFLDRMLPLIHRADTMHRAIADRNSWIKNVQTERGKYK